MECLDRPIFALDQNDRESGDVESEIISSFSEARAMDCKYPWLGHVSYMLLSFYIEEAEIEVD
jgi:hypothetical protein